MEQSLTFIHGYESKPYSGPLRVFINWAKGLIKNYPEFDFIMILFKSNPEIVRDLGDNKLKNKIIFINDYDELLRALRDFSPNIIITDDYFPRLKLVVNLASRINIQKIIIYIQFLFGVHSISRAFYLNKLSFREKWLYTLSSIIPYKLLTHKYLGALQKICFFGFID